MNFNTTLVHVEPDIFLSIKRRIKKFQYNTCTCRAHENGDMFKEIERFQYNTCTCRARRNKLKKLWIIYFNTTLVHVEPKR